MVEAIVVAAAIMAAIVAVIICAIEAAFKVGPYMELRSRIKDAPYSFVCDRCNHPIDVTDQKTIEAYDNGRCPVCSAPLTPRRPQ